MDIKPDAIFFDWDGTLVDSYGFLEAGHNDVLESLSLPGLPENKFRYYFGKPRDFIYDDIYGKHADEAKKRFEVFVFENHKELLNPLEGAANLLSCLDGFGVPMGVVSNKQQHFLTAEANHLDWSKYFAAIIGASDTIPSKPSPKALEIALEQADLSDMPASRICYVGDTQADLGCAKAFGCFSIFISHGEPLQSWVYENEPHIIVESCAELTETVKRIYSSK